MVTLTTRAIHSLRELSQAVLLPEYGSYSASYEKLRNRAVEVHFKRLQHRQELMRKRRVWALRLHIYEGLQDIRKSDRDRTIKAFRKRYRIERDVAADVADLRGAYARRYLAVYDRLIEQAEADELSASFYVSGLVAKQRLYHLL